MQDQDILAKVKLREGGPDVPTPFCSLLSQTHSTMQTRETLHEERDEVLERNENFSLRYRRSLLPLADVYCHQPGVSTCHLRQVSNHLDSMAPLY